MTEEEKATEQSQAISLRDRRLKKITALRSAGDAINLKREVAHRQSQKWYGYEDGDDNWFPKQNDGATLISHLAAQDGWEVWGGSDMSGKIKGKAVSVGDTRTSDAASSHAYYRTKRAGASTKMQEARLRGATVAEALEAQASIQDAARYFYRPSISRDRLKEIAEDMIVTASRSVYTSFEDLAMLEAMGVEEEVQLLWDYIEARAALDPRAELLTVDQAVNEKIVSKKRIQNGDARRAAKEVSGWLKQALANTPPGKYAKIIAPSQAIGEAIEQYKLWDATPKQEPPDRPNGERPTLEDLLEELHGTVLEQLEKLEASVETAQAALDEQHSRKAQMPEVIELEEVLSPLVPLKADLTKISRSMQLSVSRKSTRLSDDGIISNQDVWELLYGNTEIWNKPKKKTGELLIMVDCSGSVGCICGASMGDGGAIMWAIANGLAMSYKKTVLIGYSRGLVEVPIGMRPLCIGHESSRKGWNELLKKRDEQGKVKGLTIEHSVHGGGTPDAGALAWAVKRAKNVQNMSVVMIGDGDSNNHQEVREMVQLLRPSKVAFAAIVVRPFIRAQQVRDKEQSAERFADAAKAGNEKTSAAYWRHMFPDDERYSWPKEMALEVSSAPWARRVDPASGTKTGELKRASQIYELLNKRH